MISLKSILIFYLFSSCIFLSRFLASTSSLIITIIYLKNPKIIKKNSSNVSATSLISNSNYLITVSIYGILAFFQFGLRLSFSLICKSSSNIGGYEITEEVVSLIQGFAGIFVLILPPLLTPVIDKKLGLIRSIFVLAFLLIPFTLAVSYLQFFSLY